MTSLAKALTNDTSMIEQDVNEIFAFEKEIAKVKNRIILKINFIL